MCDLQCQLRLPSGYAFAIYRPRGIGKYRVCHLVAIYCRLYCQHPKESGADPGFLMHPIPSLSVVREWPADCRNMYSAAVFWMLGALVTGRILSRYWGQYEPYELHRIQIRSHTGSDSSRREFALFKLVCVQRICFRNVSQFSWGGYRV